MKKYLPLLFSIIFFPAKAQVTTLAAGQPAPDFLLKNVDNKQVSFANFPNAKGYIIVFTCNTCPVAKKYEKRIIALNKNTAPIGYPVIAINPNDPQISNGDSFERMQALAGAKKYAFPYLYDSAQVVTNLYGAQNTPHVFIVSKTPQGNVIAYTGAIDNDPEEELGVRTNFAEQVVVSLMKNEKPKYTVSKAIGCAVKRKATK